ncbi:MAG: 4-hydroxy-3-methylbut-2-enyl diphosphate reductase, partial [Actinomycetota bacterium]
VGEVPVGRPIMLSAHGSAPAVVDAAKERGSYMVDSVCPLVTKVHHEVRTRAGKGYRIVYVGHEGHEEAVGTMAVAPDAISRVETLDEVAALPTFMEPVALLAQTTLSHREWEGVASALIAISTPAQNPRGDASSTLSTAIVFQRYRSTCSVA